MQMNAFKIQNIICILMNKLNISPWNFTNAFHSFTSNYFVGITKVNVGSMIIYTMRLKINKILFPT